MTNNGQILKQVRRARRKLRIRSRLAGTATRPRLAVFRSLKHISVQLIDDAAGKTLVSASDREVKAAKGQTKVDVAHTVGELLAKKAQGAHIETVVFDRAGFKFHGRVQAVADGAKAGGLKF